MLGIDCQIILWGQGYTLHQIDYLVHLGGNRERDQLYRTSQVSNIAWNTKFPPFSWHIFPDEIKKCRTENKEHI